MKITGRQTVQIEIDTRDLGRAILAHVMERIDLDDDGGVDWLTEERAGDFYGVSTRKVYLAAPLPECVIADRPEIAALVDAANILIYGNAMHGEEGE